MCPFWNLLLWTPLGGLRQVLKIKSIYICNRNLLSWLLRLVLCFILMIAKADIFAKIKKIVNIHIISSRHGYFDIFASSGYIIPYCILQKHSQQYAWSSTALNHWLCFWVCFCFFRLFGIKKLFYSWPHDYGQINTQKDHRKPHSKCIVIVKQRRFCLCIAGGVMHILEVWLLGVLYKNSYIIYIRSYKYIYVFSWVVKYILNCNTNVVIYCPSYNITSQNLAYTTLPETSAQKRHFPTPDISKRVRITSMGNGNTKYLQAKIKMRQTERQYIYLWLISIFIHMIKKDYSPFYRTHSPGYLE